MAPAGRMLDDAHFRSVLTPAEYSVLRERHTEKAGSGDYDALFPTSGHFACRACNAPLYSTASKFQSGCGWPAFSRCYSSAVACKPDLDNFHFCGARVELVCSACSSHLGHVFFEADKPTVCIPVGTRFARELKERHCVNSLSIRHIDSSPPTPPNDDRNDAAGAHELAHEREEQSLRQEHDECMDKAMQLLAGDPAATLKDG